MRFKVLVSHDNRRSGTKVELPNDLRNQMLTKLGYLEPICSDEEATDVEPSEDRQVEGEPVFTTVGNPTRRSNRSRRGGGREEDGAGSQAERE